MTLTIDRAVQIHWSAFVAGVLEPRVYSLARARGMALLPGIDSLKQRTINAQLAASNACANAVIGHYFPRELLQGEILDGSQLHRVAGELRRILDELESAVRGERLS